MSAMCCEIMHSLTWRVVAWPIGEHPCTTLPTVIRTRYGLNASYRKSTRCYLPMAFLLLIRATRPFGRASSHLSTGPDKSICELRDLLVGRFRRRLVPSAPQGVERLFV